MSDLANLLFANKGEALVESLDSDKEFCLGIFSDGIYERRNTKIGSFAYKKHDIKTPYLTKEGSSDFKISLPKPPVGMLYGIANFFKSIMRSMSNSEVMVQIYWNIAKEKYFIYVPKQQVSGASIKFEHSQKLQDNPDMYWVLDIHSHNTMGAFFSGTDSADERSTRIFGVLGKLNQKEFASSWRAGVNGSFHKLELDEIWDMSQVREWTVPTKMANRVTRLTYSSYKVKSPGAVTKASSTGPKWIRRNQLTATYPGAYAGFNDEDFNFYAQQAALYEGFDIDHSADFDDLVMEKWGDIDDTEELYVECLSLTDDLEKIYAAELSGTLGSTELSQMARTIIRNFSDFEGFGESVAMAIIDELSQNTDSSEFSKIIELYNEVHNVA